MMGFTMSRAVLFVCGAVLVAAIVLPFGNVADSDTDRRMGELARSEADVIDRFYDSVLDELYINGTELLPSQSYSMLIDGYLLTITGPGEKHYSAPISHPARHIDVGYGETVTVVRDGEWIT